ncbi:MAG: 4Fe-4S dicluster domain-containing protein [Hyphomicrobiales bacterium]|nr:4Fe-4S dicluster domain-containing protein [Hyphomicrobiales bacterium]MCP5373865.1 4Fe-4S dicluster domain-containing protein [Hyphomicrobiales bacterium]
MSAKQKSESAARVVPADGLDALIRALARAGYTTIGPRVEDGAVTYRPVGSAADLPLDMVDEQGGGTYRLRASKGAGYFAHVVGPHSWKRYLYPPRQLMWRASRARSGFAVEAPEPAADKLAFIGVRACELRAMEIQDRVFDNGQFTDPGYRARRAAALVVAVNCGRAGDTCFCVSAGGGPRVEDGYDILLTEFPGKDHTFLVQAGSARGARVVKALRGGRDAGEADLRAAQRRTDAAAKAMGRELAGDAPQVLRENLEHPHWQRVAERCLNCANCTMVCPTCFCSTVEDVTALDGSHAERWRTWDSCFTTDFSYIHGGAIRRGGAARYRQWITHKLASWHEQFGTSGCTGCGRCITWCPVGIDITEEVRALAARGGRK